MVTVHTVTAASPSNSKNSNNKEDAYEKDFDEKDFYYNFSDNSPYRENPVPIDYYRRMKSDLLKTIRFNADETNRLSSRIGDINYEKTRLFSQIQNLEEQLKNNKISKVQNIFLFILIGVGLFYSGRYVSRHIRSGEVGFSNSETALRKHLRSINQADGVFVSCRVEPQSTNENIRICSSNRNFCTVSQSSVDDKYFCCSSGDADVNSGCRIVSGTIVNGIFRPRSNQ